MEKPTQPNGPAEFPTPVSMGHRIWGNEIRLFALPGRFVFKKIEMRKGHKGGLQYHHKRHELAILISGSILVRYDPGDGTLSEKVLSPGEVTHFPPGAVHQDEALEDSVLVEVSAPFDNDRVRVEEAYGIDDASGLPTTRIEDVIEY